jgi:hypothetical protein
VNLKLLSPQLHPHDLAALPNFYPSDTLKRYRQNLVKQGPEWPWRRQLVSYELNSDGYRARPWDQIDWANSIVCFGCSWTFGVGLTGEQTWPALVETISGIPTVNLGMPGSSVQWAWINTVRLIVAGIRPRALVYYWPDPSRSCEFVEPDLAMNWGNWYDFRGLATEVGSVGHPWVLRTQHNQEMARHYIQGCLWPHAPQRLDLTWSNDLRDLASVRQFKIDLARDQIHPGPFSQRLFAESVVRDLKI